jgi:Calx-beta domain
VIRRMLALMTACAALPAFAQVPPIVTIDDASAVEGNAGQTNMIFNIHVNAVSTAPVVMHFAATPLSGNGFNTPQGGTACGGNVDFVLVNPPQTLTIQPGSVSTTAAVTVCGDTRAEPDEHIFVNLEPVSGGTCLEGTCNGIGTIRDDDGPPTILISNASGREPVSGTRTVTFDVRLSHVFNQPVRVNFATADVTAHSKPPAGQRIATCPLVDYFSRSGQLFFAAGQLVPQTPLEITICGDTANEPNETFRVILSTPQNATLSDTQAIGTIVNGGLPTLQR